MKLFCGGLTKEMVDKILNNEERIFNHIEDANIHVPAKNTFLYAPLDYYQDYEKLKEYLYHDIDENQYLFFATKLSSTFEFCVNSLKKNYILVCEFDEKSIENYIGVGKYNGYGRLEYRIPRKVITQENIVEYLYFEPYDEKQMASFKCKYEDDYACDYLKEDKKAEDLIKRKSLSFNYNRLNRVD